MNREKLQEIQGKLEGISRRWWFFLIFILMQVLLPPFASKGFDWSKCQTIAEETSTKALIYSSFWRLLYPLFQIIPIALIASLIFFKNKVVRLFNIYVAISYALFAVLQNIAITKKYGFSIVTVNVVMFVVVSLVWLWEAIVLKNDFTPTKRPLWKYWVVPLAFLAFWYPLNPQTLKPDFNPLYLLTSPAGSSLAFCLLTPVYLAILTLYYPNVNTITLRVTSLVGVIIGLWNMLLNFGSDPAHLWWNGMLHIPLLTISIYGLVLSFKKRPVEK